MWLTLLNYILKSGSDCKFYVICVKKLLKGLQRELVMILARKVWAGSVLLLQGKKYMYCSDLSQPISILSRKIE
jgi:hypothetical protein